MNRRHLLLIISYFFVFLITINCGSKPEDSEYVPLKAGSYKYIQETTHGEEKSSIKVAIDILEPREVEGLKVIPRELKEIGFEFVLTEFLIKKEDGIVQVGTQIKDIDGIHPPSIYKKEGKQDEYILKYPIRAGKKWEHKTECASTTYEYENIDEEIQIENHTYKNCLRLKAITHFCEGENEDIVTRWFAPGIGMVKFIADNEKESSHIELYLIR